MGVTRGAFCAPFKHQSMFSTPQALHNDPKQLLTGHVHAEICKCAQLVQHTNCACANSTPNLPLPQCFKTCPASTEQEFADHATETGCRTAKHAMVEAGQAVTLRWLLPACMHTGRLLQSVQDYTSLLPSWNIQTINYRSDRQKQELLPVQPGMQQCCSSNRVEHSSTLQSAVLSVAEPHSRALLSGPEHVVRVPAHIALNLKVQPAEAAKPCCCTHLTRLVLQVQQKQYIISYP
jgi:hypothetical protein